MEDLIPASFFSDSAVATFIITPEHEVKFWNKACEHLTGVSSEQVLSTKEHWQAFYQEERWCLVDIVIAGKYSDLPTLYEKYGKSTLSPEGIRAEGWFENLGGRRRYIIFDAAPIYNAAGQLIAAIETLQDITDIKNNEVATGNILQELENTLARTLPLQGFIPICSSCKDVRGEKAEWISIEDYLLGNSEILFSHSICPTCARKLYPEFYDKVFK